MTNEIDSSEDKVIMPKSFGAAFREAREQAGFSIERAAVATRISASFIEALEAQKFAVLPGEVFGRGFVRNLCRAYGTDAKPLVAAYDLAIASQLAEQQPETSRDGKSKTSRASASIISPRASKIDTAILRDRAAGAWNFSRPALIAVPILLGLLFVGQTAYKSYKNSAENALPASTAAVIQAPTTPAPAVVPAPEAVVPSVIAPEDLTQFVAKGEGIDFVDITVKEPVQIRYGRDKDKQIIEILQPQSYRFSFNEQLRLLINDMSLVEIRFKDQAIPNKGVKGEARYMTFAVSESDLAKNREKNKL